jgi:uncharacterized cupredoxin-like copper-binding protein
MRPPIRPPRTAPAIAVAVIAASLLIGCSDSVGSPATSGGIATAVDVHLQEWSVNPSPDSVPAGEVTFSITNDGPDDIHEFVVIATDLDPGALPTDETGTVDENGEGIEVIDEIEEVPVGETEELTVSLDPGNYVLVCNVYSADENEAHYQMGMHTAFTVDE